MIWTVVKNSDGSIQLFPSDASFVLPEMSTVEGTTANPEQFYPTPEGARRNFLSQRQAMVDSIVVTTSSGKSFDGDETSQNRMVRAIIALESAGVPSAVWVLADNTPSMVTVSELKEALALAGAEQARIWVSN